MSTTVDAAELPRSIDRITTPMRFDACHEGDRECTWENVRTDISKYAVSFTRWYSSFCSSSNAPLANRSPLAARMAPSGSSPASRESVAIPINRGYSREHTFDAPRAAKQDTARTRLDNPAGQK